MSEFKGTPGPWHVVLSDNATPHILHEHGCDSTDCADLSSRVCVMPAEIVANYNSLTNAHLIAAAPELLSLLIEARSTLEMWKDVAPAVSLCADIDNAIAKALGEDQP